MLEGGIIAKLLDEKWKTFAMMMFYKKMLFQIIHLLCISFAIYSRPEFDQPLMRGLQPETQIEDEDIVRYIDIELFKSDKKLSPDIVLKLGHF